MKQKIKDISILKVADRLGISYTAQGRYRNCLCFMHDDHHPSMWLKPANDTWCCPVCDKRGDAISLVMEYRKCSFKEAVQWFIDEFNIIDSRPPVKQYRSSTPVLTQPSLKPSIMQSDTNHNTYLDNALLTKCFSTKSPFCTSLVSNDILTHDQMQQAAHLYHLGKTLDDGVIFWQIDPSGQVREGKIMYYKTDNHRDHDKKPTTVSSRLIHKHLLPPTWQASSCLFGLHLLKGQTDPVIAVVESEKTAVICSILFPTFLWMATGGLSLLTVERLRPLMGYRVTLFPDTDPQGETYRKWSDIAHQATLAFHHPIYVSNILEQEATPEQKLRKIDIIDLLLES